MRFRLIVLLGAALMAAACQGPPPTQIVLVVTATPEGAIANPSAETAQVAASPSPTTAAVTVTAAATATLDPAPTPTIGQIQLAEQVFERGRMFWIQPRKQIWVMIDNGQGGGKWSLYDDTYVEGEPALDPSIVPPSGMYQPERGFGKLWRSNPDLKNALGFGLTPEFGYVSNYEYHPGGQLDSSGKWVLGPGYHILNSLYQEKFQFNEADGTWKRL